MSGVRRRVGGSDNTGGRAKSQRVLGNAGGKKPSGNLSGLVIRTLYMENMGFLVRVSIYVTNRE